MGGLSDSPSPTSAARPAKGLGKISNKGSRLVGTSDYRVQFWQLPSVYAQPPGAWLAGEQRMKAPENGESLAMSHLILAALPGGRCSVHIKQMGKLRLRGYGACWSHTAGDGREALGSSGQSDCKAQAASTTQAPPDQRAMEQATQPVPSPCHHRAPSPLFLALFGLLRVQPV